METLKPLEVEITYDGEKYFFLYTAITQADLKLSAKDFTDKVMHFIFARFLEAVKSEEPK